MDLLKIALLVIFVTGCSTTCDATVCKTTDGPKLKQAQQIRSGRIPVIRCTHSTIIVMSPKAGFDYCKCAKGAFKGAAECR